MVESLQSITDMTWGRLAGRSDGLLELDELITNRHPLDAIEDGYQAMRDGTNLRGVVVHD
jgi:Zn-dependent alcohol dehydrogenase